MAARSPLTRLLAVAAVVALAPACAASDPSTVDAAPSPTTVSSSPTPGSPSAVAPPPPTGPVVAGGDGIAPTPTGASPAAPAAGVPAAADRGPGTAAGHLLQPTGARRLVVQIVTQGGAEPHRATLDRLVQVLGDASGKPVTTAGGTAPARSTWSSADIAAAAAANPLRLPDGTAVVSMVFVHGRSDQGDDVLGLAPSATVAAVFVDRVAASAGGLVTAATIERAVAVHELGHLLGLVDLFRDTGRDDPDHPGHSTNRRSVMYWAVESTLVGDLLGGGPPQDFDDADRADLAAIRGG